MSRVADSGQNASGSCRPTVRYAYVLLSIQGALWALASVAAIAVCADPANWRPAAARGGQLAGYIAVSMAAAAVPAGLSAVSVRLAVCLERGMNIARTSAVVLEGCMTCFGVLVAYYTAAAGAGLMAILPVSAGLTGSALSVTAALALLGRGARAFTRLDPAQR
jgi:hypothetical protein